MDATVVSLLTTAVHSRETSEVTSSLSRSVSSMLFLSVGHPGLSNRLGLVPSERTHKVHETLVKIFWIFSSNETNVVHTPWS